MVKRMCPVCDREMSSEHYCNYCRMLVRRPVVRNVTYRLNESRKPANKDATYNRTMQQLMGARGNAAGGTGSGGNAAGGTGSGGNAAGGTGSGGTGSGGRGQQPAYGRMGRLPGTSAAAPPQMPVSPANRPAGKNGSQRQSRQPVSAGGTGTPAPAAVPKVRRRQGKSRLGSLFVLLVFFGMGSGIFQRAYDAYIDQKTASVYEKLTDSDTYTEAEFGTPPGAAGMLDEFDVIAAGEACSAVGHFDIDGDVIAADVVWLLNELGLSVEYETQDTWNERYETGATWFSSWRTFQLKEAGEGDFFEDSFIQVDSDTATGNLHQIYGTLSSPDTTVSLTARLLLFMEDYALMETPLKEAGITEAAMMETLMSDGTYWAAHEGILVWIVPSDGHYKFYIYKDQQDMSEGE